MCYVAVVLTAGCVYHSFYSDTQIVCIRVTTVRYCDGILSEDRAFVFWKDPRLRPFVRLSMEQWLNDTDRGN
jgi:hypothetical protein